MIATLARVRSSHALTWFLSRPQLLLTLAVLATLGPALTKPFNVDDPLFLWAARHIVRHPFNPYGFEVNWYGWAMPMWEVTKNPPLACYFLAIAGLVLGWSEVALHAACLLPAIAVILGTYRLARRWCQRPLLAAFLTLFTPVYLVSASTVMCDVLMLAFLVWAVVLWIEGLETDRPLYLAGAGVLIGLAALSKYFGMCLVPLLLIYGLSHGLGIRRPLRRWLGFLLIPIAMLAAYQRATHGLYGKGLVFDAGAYALTERGLATSALIPSLLNGLAFTGGCFAVATLVMWWTWRPRALAAFVALGTLSVFLVFRDQPLVPPGGATGRFLQVQLWLWAVGGVSVLAMAVEDARRRRDAVSGLLLLWIVGTFAFTVFVNWTVNGRSMLPMAPAVGILLARRLDQQASFLGGPVRRWGMNVSLVAGAVIAVAVSRGDFLLARAVRESARRTYDLVRAKDAKLWFGGHWGFQYYLARLGPKAQAVVNGQLEAKDGDLLANPTNNANIQAPSPGQFDSVEELSVQGPQWLTTLNGQVGAGFYVSSWGPLPFSFAEVPPETVTIYHLTTSADITLVTADRADLDCAAPAEIEGFRCGFADPAHRLKIPDQKRLQPVMTRGRHMYLIPGLFVEPAISARYQSEPPDKPRDQLKRFTAVCRIRVAGRLTGVRTRWSPDGAWTDPDDIDVGVLSDCTIIDD
jgi:4-amino-4-deoxy-L-arabinose transferase-like glycosyltransferase